MCSVSMMENTDTARNRDQRTNNRDHHNVPISVKDSPGRKRVLVWSFFAGSACGAPRVSKASAEDVERKKTALEASISPRGRYCGRTGTEMKDVAPHSLPCLVRRLQIGISRLGRFSAASGLIHPGPAQLVNQSCGEHSL
jgi:hypothetical protein